MYFDHSCDRYDMPHDLDYKRFYDYVVMERQYLMRQELAFDYRLCKVLAACYELQDYLAGQIAKNAAGPE